MCLAYSLLKLSSRLKKVFLNFIPKRGNGIKYFNSLKIQMQNLSKFVHQYMRTKILFFSMVLLSVYSSIGQRSIPATDSLILLGKILHPAVIRIADLDTFTKSVIPDQIIYNHRGEVKDTLTGLRGVPIKSLLASIQYTYAKPRDLNEFYFVFIASDGYKVVCSWNEMYNTESGNKFFIVTEMKGKKLKELDQRIMFISAADLQSGRRYIKGLEKIEVRRVE